MERLLIGLVLICSLIAACNCNGVGGRNFTVDYKRNTFLKDGVPFRYISGCMHYFRVPSLYWRDRLRKMKAGGLDAVQTYIPWNFHVEDGNYNFIGQRDIVSFLRIAQEEGLLAIIRGLPYSCAEWEMGGLPNWLLKSEYNPPDDPIILRSSHPKFLSAVQDWLDVILPMLRPLLYNNGGPVIMVQVENEYGSYYAQDETYLKSLYFDISSRLDNNVVLFTTDGNGVSYLTHGGVQGALQTVDFGPTSDVNASFTLLRKYQPDGPIVNSEYYTGWLDHWGEKQHHRTSSELICKAFDEMLSMNASVNFYMFTGGTNFEYWSGANGPPPSQITTSYDYDSPISENGDTTEKYFKIREVIAKYKQLPILPIPANISTHTYGNHYLINKGQFWNHMQALCPNGPMTAVSPKSFEDLGVLGGYVLYTTTVPPFESADRNLWLTMTFENTVRDRAIVYINEEYVGEVLRGQYTITLGHCVTGDKINILVESMGRICYGSGINDSKGIDGQVKLTDYFIYSVWLTGWSMCHLNLDNINSITNAVTTGSTTSSASPMIFTTTLYLQEVADTFIDFSGGNWTTGYVVVNGFNLGKYEPEKGPQKTLYMPTKTLLEDEPLIHVAVFEMKPSAMCGTPGTYCSLNFIDRPNLG